jgi:hypothetical protein
MRKSIVVTYTVHPAAYAEHVSLIEGVFAQLRDEHPDTVDYQVLCLADGVSFVHVSTHDTEDGANPLPELAAFREFGRDIAERVTALPTPSEASIIGSYRGRGNAV